MANTPRWIVVRRGHDPIVVGPFWKHEDAVAYAAVLKGNDKLYDWVPRCMTPADDD